MSKLQLVFEDASLTKKERRAYRRQVSAALQDLTPKEVKDNSNDLPVKMHQPPKPGSYFSFGVNRPKHSGTGYQLAAANPFAAAELYESAGPVIGLELQSGGRPFTFDPHVLYLRGLVTSPNLLVQGSLRRGKSFFVKRLVCLLSMFGRYAINTSDSKGEHGVVAEALGGQVIRIGGFGNNVRINPLERGQRYRNQADAAYEAMVRSNRRMVLQQIITQILPNRDDLEPREKSVLDWALEEEIQRTGDDPTIRGVWEVLQEVRDRPDLGFERTDAGPLIDSLRLLVSGELEGMFDGHSTVTLDPLSPYTVIDTYEMAQRGDLALAITQSVTNAWVQNTIADKTSGRRYFVIREEGWRDMNTVSALEAHRLQLKLSGEYGITMVMIVHEDGDFDAVGSEGSRARELAKGLLKGYANRITFMLPQAALKDAVRAGTYSQNEADMISVLDRGQFLVKLHSGSYLVDGRPTTTEWERHLFDTDQAMNSRATESEGPADE